MAQNRPTHQDLVNRAARWLRKDHSVVAKELRTFADEEADVIGWSPARGARSTLIECKRTRRDFFKDKDKVFRIPSPEMGMGDRRFYATPPGLLKVSELPEGWGLLEVHEKQIRVVQDSKGTPANKRAECIVLCSILRRQGLKGDSK